MDVEGDVQVVDSVGWFVDNPAKVKFLEALFEVVKFANAVWSACPIPNTNAIVDVPSPVEEIFSKKGIEVFLMGMEEKGCPHTCGWGAHGCARELLPVGIRKLEDVVVHDEGKGS